MGNISSIYVPYIEGDACKGFSQVAVLEVAATIADPVALNGCDHADKHGRVSNRLRVIADILQCTVCTVLVVFFVRLCSDKRVLPCLGPLHVEKGGKFGNPVHRYKQTMTTV